MNSPESKVDRNGVFVMDCEIIEARNLLGWLAVEGWQTVVGGFDSCDPCMRAIVRDDKVAKGLAKEYVADYVANSDYSRQEAREIRDSFAWQTWPLSDCDDFDALAADLVHDCRLVELRDAAKGARLSSGKRVRGTYVTIPD